jgi:C4-dicarboxylate transporter DctM subunit
VSLEAGLVDVALGQPPVAPPPGRGATAWTHFVGVVGWINEAIVLAALAFELAITIANVLDRYFTGRSILWSQDAAEICLTIVAFCGGAAAIRRGRVMALTYFRDRLPLRWREPVHAASYWAVLLFTAVLLKASPNFLSTTSGQTMSLLKVNAVANSMWLVIGYCFIAIYAVDALRALGVKAAAYGAAVCAGMCVLFILYREYAQPHLHADPAYVFLAVLVIGFMAGVPIAFVLGLAALSFIEITHVVTPASLPVTSQYSVSGFILLAIPFFMLAGVLMERGGLAAQIGKFLTKLLGRVPGGLLIAEIFGVYVFSGISGSKFADIAAIGSAMSPEFKRAGYPPKEFAAVLSASAVMSETVPPSLPILVLASITSLSTGQLFLGGILPAAVMGGFLIAAILVMGLRGGLPRGERSTFAEVARSVPSALPALALPILLVAGIVGGFGTPTEMSAFAAAYGLIIATLAYAKLRRGAWDALVEAASLSGMTLLIVSTAGLFSQVLVIDQIPVHITDFLEHTGGRTTFLVLSIGGLVVMGALLEGLGALLVFAPLLIPIAATLGVDTLQYGLLLIIAMGLGSFLPPIGIGVYVAAAIAGTTVEETMKPTLRYLFVLALGLVVLTAFPSITLWLPHLVR